MPIPEGGMTPAVSSEGTMAPAAPAQPTEVEVEQKAVENLNVAQAGAMEALDAAQAAPQVSEETEQKIENAVVLLDEAKQEISAVSGAGEGNNMVPAVGTPSGGEG